MSARKNVRWVTRGTIQFSLEFLPSHKKCLLACKYCPGDAYRNFIYPVHSIPNKRSLALYL